VLTSVRLVALGLLAVLAAGPSRPAGVSPAAAGRQSGSGDANLALTGRMHHLRHGAAREWSDFPAEAESPALILPFDASPNAGERTLKLRHRDVKASWRMLVNGRVIDRIPADEADTIGYWAIPPDTLRDGGNELRIEASGGAPDDVWIGDVSLIDRARSAILTEATIDVVVQEAPGGRPVPSRLTVSDEHGTLVPLGNASDATHAVRPGVVYSATGATRLQLPAGRYVIHAGRGFEYSVDRLAVAVGRGETATHRLTIRREVDTTGWAAMDTHVHTATFARHGDATIGERMLTLAGEGIELPVSTEHNTRVDFEARAGASDVRAWFTPILGTEVTTPTHGHFNVFPVAAGGSDIDHRAPDWARLRRSMDAVAPAAMVVLNHGRDVHGGFRPLDPARHVGIAGEDLDGWRLPANAMEILNSGAVMSDALALTRDWMGLLNRGLRLTPVGSSDSHDVARYIVGQGRTYVRSDDGRPDAINLARAIDSVLKGRVLISYGLLAEIDVGGHGPGELVHPGEELAVRIRVKGPGWTRADHVALYANGTLIREEVIPDGAKAGVKWGATWRMSVPAHDVHLVAVATGPGITAPYWPTAKPYQPTSPEFTPYVLGVSGAVFVDADRGGTFESALDYARRETTATADPRQLAPRLARYDAAVAIQAASLLRARDPAGFAATIDAVRARAAPHVAAGLQAYVDARRLSDR
jgi:hypothetical protein